MGRIKYKMDSESTLCLKKVIFEEKKIVARVFRAKNIPLSRIVSSDPKPAPGFNLLVSMWTAVIVPGVLYLHTGQECVMER